MRRRKPSSAFSVASMVAAPSRPCVKVSLPSSTPRVASSRMRMGWPGGASATTSRMADAPMSTTASGRGVSGAGGGGFLGAQRPAAGRGHQARRLARAARALLAATTLTRTGTPSTSSSSSARRGTPHSSSSLSPLGLAADAAASGRGR